MDALLVAMEKLGIETHKPALDTVSKNNQLDLTNEGKDNFTKALIGKSYTHFKDKSKTFNYGTDEPMMPPRAVGITSSGMYDLYGKFAEYSISLAAHGYA